LVKICPASVNPANEEKVPNRPTNERHESPRKATHTTVKPVWLKIPSAVSRQPGRIGRVRCGAWLVLMVSHPKL
jgi:hypothetical protein